MEKDNRGSNRDTKHQSKSKGYTTTVDARVPSGNKFRGNIVGSSRVNKDQQSKRGRGSTKVNKYVEIEKETKDGDSGINLNEEELMLNGVMDANLLIGGKYDGNSMEAMRKKVLEKASVKVIQRQKVKPQKKTHSYQNNEGQRSSYQNSEASAYETANYQRTRSSKSKNHEPNVAKGYNDIKTHSKHEQNTTQFNPNSMVEVNQSRPHINDKSTNVREPSPSFPKQTNTLFNCDAENSPRFSHRTNSPAVFGSSVVPLMPLPISDDSSGSSQPRCDADVHLWLRRLGLLEEEKYIRVFAENEIDMDELIRLSPDQLQKMGVVAVGALNKISRGIDELCNPRKSVEKVSTPRTNSGRQPVKLARSASFTSSRTADKTKHNFAQGNTVEFHRSISNSRPPSPRPRAQYDHGGKPVLTKKPPVPSEKSSANLRNFYVTAVPKQIYKPTTHAKDDLGKHILEK